MPFPYFDNISTDFTGTWTSPRKRKKTAEPDSIPIPLSPTPKRTKTPCPHSMTVLRSTRQLAAENRTCPVCLEDYFSTPPDQERIVPVKMACSHIFCRSCIETHLSSSMSCPLPWCASCLPLDPESCALCTAWQKDHAAQPPLVVTVRASEMLGSIKSALGQLSLEHDVYMLPNSAKDKLLQHIKHTLRKYEWQFHSDVDLAELLDPFLLAIDPDAAREHFGPAISSPAPDPRVFPPREHDPDDYEMGAEPWVAAFLRAWALEYVKENGEVGEGWGVWSRKKNGEGGEEEDASWEWPYKRILAHRMADKGGREYLVKWVGRRYWSSWIEGGMLDVEARTAYDDLHGLGRDGVEQEKGGKRGKRKKSDVEEEEEEEEVRWTT
ncbi:hypothetical protein IAQ61_009549 [Plenodomus lingam]|uniref:uncharacterized protein n=1 Tax=Leptosphaeria maculans TaxID=5022 RepID=UPI00331C142E|nr:hypothetical protein IAQ61_009549 [Plenodomus lingam]